MLIITKARLLHGTIWIDSGGGIDESYHRGWRNNECSIDVQFMLRRDQKAHKFYVTNLFLHKQFLNSTQAQNKDNHLDQNFDLNM